MPSILQLEHMDYRDVSETIFLGGTALTDRTATSFVTRSDDYTITFSGRDLTYDEAGTLTGGTLESYRVYGGEPGVGTAEIIVDSNFVLLTAGELAEAFTLFAGGDEAAANAVVMTSWLGEYFSHTNYSGDDMHGYQTGEFLSSGSGGDIFGRGGDDTMLMGGTGGLALGGAGSDHIYGSSGNDTLKGGDGNDYIYNDRAQHDQSSDLLYGGAGNDGLLGSNAADTAYGGGGDDQVSATFTYGGSGADLVSATRFASQLYGGTGNDSLHGKGASDLLSGGTDDDQLFAGLGDDTLSGGTGNDTLQASAGNDLLSGDRGNDVLYAFSGDDTLFGGSGADQLYAAEGAHQFTGGSGADTFHFRPLAATDVITDFEAGRDTIWLKQFDFADLATVEALGTDTEAGASFDLGSGQTLLVQGVTVAELLDDLVI